MDKPRFRAVVTIEVEGPGPEEFGQALSNAFDIVSFGGVGGDGHTPNGTRYTCRVETNLPTKPMTIEALLGESLDNFSPEQREDLIKLYESWSNKAEELRQGQAPER